MRVKGRQVLSLFATIAVLSCASCQSSNSAQSQATAEATTRPIPPDSPFAKLKEGMQNDEVYATIGQPTSQETYQTGKAWIPFRIGGDNYRTTARYKGIGTLTFKQEYPFSTTMTLLSIDYDPDEPGFDRSHVK